MDDSVLAAIDIDHLQVSYGSQQVLHGVSLSVASGRVHGDPRLVGLRQNHAIAHHRRISEGGGRGDPPVWAGRREHAARKARHRHDVPVLRALAAHDACSAMSATACGCAACREGSPRARREVLALLNLLGARGAQGDAAFGRPAPARRARPGARHRAELLLLDEPLSNLDAKVRIQLRTEIKSLQNRLGFTAMYVTHDREEAMTMADRIVVMDAGPHHPVRRAGGGLRPARPRPSSRASWAPRTRSTSTCVPSGDGVEVAAPEALRAVAGEAGDAAGRGHRLFSRRCGERSMRRTPRSPARSCCPGASRSARYPGGHYRYAVATGDRHFTVTDDRYHDVDARSACACRWRSLHLFPKRQRQGRTP